MAELEMLPEWAGRLAEPTHPPQPPTPPPRSPSRANEASDANGSGTESGLNGDHPTANGRAPAVMTGQPPHPPGDHRLEPEPGSAVPPANDEDSDNAGARAPTMTTGELPVVSIPLDNGSAPGPEPSAPDADSLVGRVEAPAGDRPIIDPPIIDDPVVYGPMVDDPIMDAELTAEGRADGEQTVPAGYGEAPGGEGLLEQGDQGPHVGGAPDEIVDEPDEIELLEETDPIGLSADHTSPAVVPVTPPDQERSQGRRDREAARDRPARRVLSLLALALLVVAAGVAAGYLFVALTGG
ncbi:MAG: hypothetical protein OEY41_13250 [Acidimicrobiia bacterium]|nr:hypothetical protein [Acidimicrobiia bacterium]